MGAQIPFRYLVDVICTSHLTYSFKWSKGLLTAEGGRGQITTYMYCVTIKIKTVGSDILKIVHQYSEFYNDVQKELWS